MHEACPRKRKLRSNVQVQKGARLCADAESALATKKVASKIKQPMIENGQLWAQVRLGKAALVGRGGLAWRFALLCRQM
jgi:hypothetical protein